MEGNYRSCKQVRKTDKIQEHKSPIEEVWGEGGEGEVISSTLVVNQTIYRGSEGDGKYAGHLKWSRLSPEEVEETDNIQDTSGA